MSVSVFISLLVEQWIKAVGSILPISRFSISMSNELAWKPWQKMITIFLSS